MPVDPKDLLIAARSAVNGHVETPRTRTRKADRDPNGPPELGLRVGDPQTGIAAQLYAHFQRARGDREYAARWEAFLRDETRNRLSAQERLAEWHEARRDQPYEPRVQASKIKECARQQWFKLAGFPESDEVGADKPHWSVSAMVGEELHHVIETALKFIGVAKKAEFRVYAESEEHGKYLGGIVDVDTEDAILDIKTVGPDDFKEGAWGSKIQGYIAQISVYGRLTGRTKGVILLADRGSGKFQDFWFDIDPDYADKMLRRAHKIVEYAKARRFPKPEEFANGRPTFKCFNFCPFRSMCFFDARYHDAEGESLIQKWLDEGQEAQAIFESLKLAVQLSQEAPDAAGTDPAGEVHDPVSE